jgi:hypothetical protein
MTSYAIAVALFAAFVVGGVLAKAVPLRVVVLPASRSGPACSCSLTGTRACPGADG